MLLENNTSQADTSELPAIIAAGAAESAAGQLAAIRYTLVHPFKGTDHHFFKLAIG